MVFGFNGIAINFKVEPVNISSLVIITEIKFSRSIFQQLVGEGGTVILIGIGPKMDPDKIEGVGWIIEIIHLDESVQGMVGIL